MTSPKPSPTCATCPWLEEPAFLLSTDAGTYPRAKVCGFIFPGHSRGAMIPNPEGYGCSMHPQALAWATLEAERVEIEAAEAREIVRALEARA